MTYVTSPARALPALLALASLSLAPPLPRSRTPADTGNWRSRSPILSSKSWHTREHFEVRPMFRVSCPRASP
jgi:hypothetical protein